jgi:uncharacterized protein (TIGR02449 family)
MIMDELLNKLENQLKELVGEQQQLKQNNQLLSEGKRRLAREKDFLLTRQQKAVSDIAVLLSQLKAIEKSS